MLRSFRRRATYSYNNLLLNKNNSVEPKNVYFLIQLGCHHKSWSQSIFSFLALPRTIGRVSQHFLGPLSNKYLPPPKPTQTAYMNVVWYSILEIYIFGHSMQRNGSLALKSWIQGCKIFLTPEITLSIIIIIISIKSWNKLGLSWAKLSTKLANLTRCHLPVRLP